MLGNVQDAKVDVVSPSEFVENKDQFESDTRFFWLGGTPRLRRKVEVETGIRFNVDPQFQGLFHRVFQEVSCELSELFAKFANANRKANRSGGFWQTSIASKSSASEPVVRSLVLVLCAQRLISTAQARVVIVAESAAIGLCLSSLYDPGRISRWRRRWVDSAIKLFAKAVAKHVVFIFRASRLYVDALVKGRRPLFFSGDRPRLLMRTWITKGVFHSSDGKLEFQDRNFGHLRDFFTEQGFEVWLLPMFFNIDESEQRELAKLRAASCKVVDEFSEISPWDIVSVVGSSLRQMFLDSSELKLRVSGLLFDVSSLFRESHWKTHGAPDLLRLNLVEKTLSQLARKKIKWSGLYYPFENNPSEKPFLTAARDCYPAVPVIGFQHTVIFRDQLSMRLSPAEAEFHPLPTRLLCSGPVYLPVLKSLGFPETRCELGANLRYRSIGNDRRWSIAACRGCRLLYVLNFKLDDAFEALSCLAPVFKKLKAERPELELRLKSHPLIDREMLFSILRDLELDRDVVLVEGSVQDEVLASRVVFMTGASVSNLETLVVGAPLVRFSLEQDFDFDCLWPEFVDRSQSLAPFVRSEDELYTALRRRLIAETEGPVGIDVGVDVAIELTKKLRDAYFSDPKASQLSVFLPKGSPSGT